MRDAEKAQAAAATTAFGEAADSGACERLDHICRKNWQIPREMLQGLERLTVPFTINKAEYEAVYAYLEKQEVTGNYTGNLRLSTAQLNRLAYKAYLLFGTPEKLVRFCKDYNETRAHPRRTADVLTDLKFPPVETWQEVDFRLWGEAFLQ